MDNKLEQFCDETQSGEYQPELRDLFRVDFAARISLENDFGWFEALEKKYKGKDIKHPEELKSGLLIELAKQDRKLWDDILKNIYKATIVIIDLTQYFRIYLQQSNQTTNTFTALIKSQDIADDFRKHIFDRFKEMCFRESSIPYIESIANRAFGSLKLYDNNEKLIGNEQLLSLKQRELNELVARFSIALGDALDPVLEEQMMKNILAAQRYYSDGLEAYYLLSHVIQPNVTYDTGTKAAFIKLKNTQDKIVKILEKSCWYDGSLKPGTLKQIEDSKKVMGVKVADIAAGFARIIFERNYPDTWKASNAVKNYFSRVLLNAEWL